MKLIDGSNYKKVRMRVMYVLFALIGALAGILAGLFGVGGAIVVVPGLLFAFSTYGIADGNNMHIALGTTLTGMIFTLSAAVYSYQKRHAVLWPVFYKMLPGVSVGTILGATLAGHLPSQILKIIFSIFLMIVAVRIFLLIQPKPENKIPAQWVVSFVSGLIGLTAGLLGVAGGTLTIPFLMRCNVSIRQASGTSAACGLPITLLGMICFMITGWLLAAKLPVESTGFIYWPAALIIGITSALFVPVGGLLARYLPTPVLARIFAIMIGLTAVKLIQG
jgi:uncharacterized membrane protein YfcA